MTSAFRFNDAVIRNIILKKNTSVTTPSPQMKLKERDNVKERDNGGEFTARKGAAGEANTEEKQT